MSGAARVSAVVPAMNEARNLPFVLPHLATLVDEIILVDGHSSDDTVEVARALVPSIRVISQQGKGKGDALRAGFALCEGDFVVMIDADGSNDPREISQFIDILLAGADFAKGSRFLRSGSSQARSGSADITLFRALGNKALTLLVNVLFRTRYTDLCYGYNAFKRSCLPYLQFECDGFEVETALTLRASKAKLHIVEAPSYEHSRIHGVSNLNAFSDGWYVLKTILRERFWVESAATSAYVHNPALTPVGQRAGLASPDAD